MTSLSFSVPDSVAGVFGKICLDSKRVQEEVLRELLARYIEDVEDSAAVHESEISKFPIVSMSDLRAELGL